MARFCRYCGHPLNDTASFCASCGQAVPKEESAKIEPAKASPRFCRHCGASVNPGARFCASCGGEIAADSKAGSASTVSTGHPSVGIASFKAAPASKTASGRKTASAARTAGVNNNSQASASGPRSGRRAGSPKPLIAAVLVAAVFLSFVYPGFIRTRLFGGSGGGGTGDSGKHISENSTSGNDSISGGTKEGDDDERLLSESRLPTPEELEAEYSAINAAYTAGTLFTAEDHGIYDQPHMEYAWLYSDETGWDDPAEEEDAPETEQEESGVIVLPEGHSKAFKMETPYGVTISAEENALDRDREFIFEPVSEEVYAEYDALVTEATGSPGLMIGCWELDAGLADNEMFPGTYTMEFDLDQLGLEEEDGPALQIYRIDDAGKWYEYATACNGNTVTVEASQNSLVCAIIGWTLIVLTAPGITAMETYNTGAYFNPLTGTFNLYYEGKAVMQVMLNRDQFLQALKGGHEAHYLQMKNAAMDEAYQIVSKEEYIDLPTRGKFLAVLNAWKVSEKPEVAADGARIQKRYLKLYLQILQDKIQQDPDYTRIQKNIEDYEATRKKDQWHRTELEAVSEVCKSAVKAWGWLQDELHLRMPSYKLRLELSNESKKAFGVTYSPWFSGHPYMVIYMEMLGRGDKKSYDVLLGTLCHEMFHVVQRVYVFDTVATYKFDEMSAQDVEEMAYDYFSEFPEDPITTPKDEFLHNLEDAYWFALPLDSFSTTYPEGKLSAEDKAGASYPIAPFLTYLRKDYWSEETLYKDILARYKGLWGKRSVTTILKKCFQMFNDTRLTKAYQDFALAYQARLYREALKPQVNDMFAPIASVSAKTGKQEVQLLNKNYTIRVRRVQPDKWDRDIRQYALVLRYHDDFKTAMSDFTITPLNKKEDHDYRLFDKGIFFEIKDWTDEDETLYLMEVDGGTAKTTEGLLWNNYSGYNLYLMVPPDRPEVTAVGSKLNILLPLPGEWGGKEIMDSYVIKLRTGDEDLLEVQVPRKDVNAEKPMEIDISGLKKKSGEKLSEEEMQNLVVVLQECVEGTYLSGKPCLGPESEPVACFMDIYGEWDVQFSSGKIGSSVIDQALSQIPSDNQGMQDTAALYYNAMQGVQNASNKGVLTITRTGDAEGGGAKVSGSLAMQAANGVLQETTKYTGLYDPKTNQIHLTQDLTGYAEEIQAYMNDFVLTIDVFTWDGKLQMKGEQHAAGLALNFDIYLEGTKRLRADTGRQTAK